jgi:hypothetical protein
VRALGFWQPVAELIVAGVKCTETRGRPIRTLVGERIAVHANLTTEYDRLRWDWPWREYDLRDLPHGALVGAGGHGARRGLSPDDGELRQVYA